MVDDDDVIGTLTVPTLKVFNPCISEDLLRPDILSDRDALHTHFLSTLVSHPHFILPSFVTEPGQCI